MIFGEAAEDPGEGEDPFSVAGGAVTLRLRRIYLLPNRQGLWFGALLLVMLVGSINYAVNLGFAFTFWLVGVGVVSIFHSYRNLAGLTVAAVRSEPVFAGEEARIRLGLDNRRGVARVGIRLAWDDRESFPDGLGHEEVVSEVPAGAIGYAHLPLPSRSRGWLMGGRICIASSYPLGLVRGWSWVRLPLRVLVYPRPEAVGVPLPGEGDGGQDRGGRAAGGDDFEGLRPYQAGDSWRHVHWKAAAGKGVWLTKQFQGPAWGPEVWLDWRDTEGLAVEERLSRLCRWVLEAERRGWRYGLRVPGREVPMTSGVVHREAVLSVLALFQPPQ